MVLLYEIARQEVSPDKFALLRPYFEQANFSALWLVTIQWNTWVQISSLQAYRVNLSELVCIIIAVR